MHQALVTTRYVIALALALVPRLVASSPQIAERDPAAPFRTGRTALAAVVEYFTASKNGDAARASSLIDYEEWAKELGLDEKTAKEWILRHRTSLAESYRAEKAAGSTKAFKIARSVVAGDSAVFEVTQARATGLYRWEVKLKRKAGRWVCVAFRLFRIEQ